MLENHITEYTLSSPAYKKQRNVFVPVTISSIDYKQYNERIVLGASAHSPDENKQRNE